MSNAWFRMYSEFATDPKVQSMPEHMQRRLVMLFCLNNSNTIETLHETEISFALRITDEELAATKQLFLGKKFIDEGWNIMNWDKRQYASDSSTERVRRHRDKKRNGDVTAGNVTVTKDETNGNAPEAEQSRAEADSESKNACLLPSSGEIRPVDKATQAAITPEIIPPLPKVQPVSVSELAPTATKASTAEGNLNDFVACCALLARLLGWQKLAPHDQELVAIWITQYDIRMQVLPILESKLNAFMIKNGKKPNSLKYFNKALEEKYGTLADELGRRMRTS